MTDYDDIPAMNWSSLKCLHESPLEFQHAREHPEEDKPCWVLGRASHCATLEPEAFTSRYIRAPESFPNKKGEDVSTTWALAAACEWRDAQDPRYEVLKAGDYDNAKAIAAAVRAHLHVKRLLTGGRSEVTVQWTDGATGIACKARVDYLLPDKVVDLKTCSDCGERAFYTDIARYMYHGQMAFYLDGCVAAKLLPRDAEAWIVPVETSAPHDTGVDHLTGIDLDAGRALYRKLLERYAECTAAEWWPGKAPDPRVVCLPRWAPGMREAEEMGAPMPSVAWDNFMAAQREAGR